MVTPRLRWGEVRWGRCCAITQQQHQPTLLACLTFWLYFTYYIYLYIFISTLNNHTKHHTITHLFDNSQQSERLKQSSQVLTIRIWRIATVFILFLSLNYWVWVTVFPWPSMFGHFQVFPANISEDASVSQSVSQWKINKNENMFLIVAVDFLTDQHIATILTWNPAVDL